MLRSLRKVKLLTYFWWLVNKQTIIGFLKWLWSSVKNLIATPSGLLSFLISFAIFIGWALVLVALGISSNNTWMYGTGMMVIVFWSFFPFSPMWLTIISVAIFLNNKVFKNKKIEKNDEDM